MHRASESIASLAAALAKAQVELTNPEKSLTAIVPTERREEPRTFRYAPLSSGLDIVRKALGRHAIATVQTTAIDPATQTVSLTTVLAHASGEWIASDWPVCPLADMASPRRMGAALTYARRYALFTLVGIAGEDDLDAPDLSNAPKNSGSTGQRGDAGRANGRDSEVSTSAPPAGRKPLPGPPKPVLGPDQSAALRDQLRQELASLASADEATRWAQRALIAKNTLTAADAGLVEDAFRAQVATFADRDGATDKPLSRTVTTAAQAPAATGCAAPDPDQTSGLLVMSVPRFGETVPADQGRKTRRKPKPGRHAPEEERSAPSLAVNTLAQEFPAEDAGAEAPRIDKATLALSEPRRYRDRDHLKFVSAQPCLACGRRPCDAHHLRFAQAPALGRRVSDEFTVPLCRLHH